MLAALLVVVAGAAAAPPDQFTAAVYEHAVQLPSHCQQAECSRQETVAAMAANLAVLGQQVGCLNITQFCH